MSMVDDKNIQEPLRVFTLSSPHPARGRLKLRPVLPGSGYSPEFFKNCGSCLDMPIPNPYGFLRILGISRRRILRIPIWS